MIFFNVFGISQTNQSIYSARHHKTRFFIFLFNVIFITTGTTNCYNLAERATITLDHRHFFCVCVFIYLHIVTIKGVGSKLFLGSAFLQMLELSSQTAARTSLHGEVPLSPDRIS